MNNKTKKIIRIVGLLTSLILLLFMGKLLYDYNTATRDAITTPVRINKPNEYNNNVNDAKINNPPLTRDQNDMPKSDVKVPEIG